MPDIWLDTVTPKISIAIHSLLPTLHAKGYTTLVTAKKQTQTTDMLDALKVPYCKIGDYGETPKEKLAADAKRTLEFIELFEIVGTPKVLWTHGDVASIRTAFGLKIPTRLLRSHQNRLTPPPKKPHQTSHSHLPSKIRRRKTKTQRHKQHMDITKTNPNCPAYPLHRPSGRQRRHRMPRNCPLRNPHH